MAQRNILRYIILGLLHQRDLAGYDIKKLFEGEVGDFWYSNHSQIYPELKRMQAEELISVHVQTVGKKLAKKFYHITEKGEKELQDWMREPLSKLVPSRDEFTMKLYLINDADDPRIPELFREEIARHQEKYDYLRARWQILFKDADAQRQHYGHAIILKQAILREKQRLDWLEDEYRRAKHS